MKEAIRYRMVNCSFCYKSSREVEFIIEQFTGGYSSICNECVDECNKILKEEREKEKLDSQIKDKSD